jgi:hypothetical protein
MEKLERWLHNWFGICQYKKIGETIKTPDGYPFMTKWRCRICGEEVISMKIHNEIK